VRTTRKDLSASARSRAVAGSTAVVAAVVGVGIASVAWRAPAARNVAPAEARAPLPVVVVYKDPSCGCCREWVQRMQAAGFTVQIHDVPSEAARDEIMRTQGVTPALAACHTAVVGGYVVEGHVPPDLVVRMLTEHPKIAGLAVPGMPTGSPGMDAMGGGHYDVLAFTAGGATRIYDHR
jgi:hypothetical protein